MFKALYQNAKTYALFAALIITFILTFSTLYLTLWKSGPPGDTQSPRVLIVTNNWQYGECEWGQRLMRAGQNLHWSCYYHCNSNPYPPLLKGALKRTINDINISISAFLLKIKSYFYKIDFVLYLHPGMPPIKGVPCYAFLTRNPRIFFDPKTHGLNTLGQTLHGFAGYITVYPDNRPLAQAFAGRGIRAPILTSYPTVYKTQWRGPPMLERLFFCGTMANQFGTIATTKAVLRKISEQVPLDIYGPKFAWQHIDLFAKNKLYKGLIPIDGATILKIIHDSGIVLCLHRKEHLAAGIPSARIFEAVAAGALVICDRNTFVKQVFGNNVLYIDNLMSPDKQAAQVIMYVKWARSHPREVAEMTYNAHRIFMENYTLEKQLLEIAALAKQHK